jgi:hypothetical protein
MASFLPSLRPRALQTLRSSTRSLSSTPSRLNSDPSSSTQATPDSSSSTDTAAVEVTEKQTEEAAAPQGKTGKGYRAWLSGEGARFRKGVVGRTNWIGETVRALSSREKVIQQGLLWAGEAGGYKEDVVVELRFTRR